MSYQLTVEPLGETIDVAETQTVLDACLRHGIYIPYACNHGLCSTCKIRVLEGEVDIGDASAFALLDFERAEGVALACCAQLRGDATIEADIDIDADALCFPIRDVQGTVTSRTLLTRDIMGITIAVDDGFAFQAGQYVNLELPACNGPRAFSIGSSPSDSTSVELHIRLVVNGLGTTYVHERLVVGERISFSGPFGRFFVRKSAPGPALFVAGGSGLSSVKSMVLDLVENGDNRPIFLFHGVRTRADLYFDDLFTSLAAQHTNLTYVPALSQPGASPDWQGEIGRINDVIERHFEGNFKGYKAYLCGPPAMVEASIRTLMKGRLFERDIYTERFVTQSDGEAALARTPLFKL